MKVGVIVAVGVMVAVGVGVEISDASKAIQSISKEIPSCIPGSIRKK